MVRGCEKDVSSYDVWGYRLTRCPVKQISALEYTYIQLFAERKNGILPNDGGWLNQPMKYGSVMNLLEGLMERVEKENNG